MTEQLVENISNAVSEGRLVDGDVLPSIKRIAAMSGACEMVVREAIRRLSADGVVRPRRHVGCVVRPGGYRLLRGHVLLVTQQLSTCHGSAVQAIIRDRLIRAGYYVTQSYVLWQDGKPDFQHLDEALSHPLSLVISLAPRWGISERIAARGIRLLACGTPVKEGLQGCASLRLDPSSAQMAFVERCRGAGIKSVLHIRMNKVDRVDEALMALGVKVKTLKLEPREANNGVEEAELGTLEMIERKFRRGKGWLPDLIFSSDDYMTRGMLTAFAHHGVRVPEDVRLVTMANRGNGPWYFKSIARIERDWETYGEEIAATALRMLKGKRIASRALPFASYIDGETFPGKTI